MHLDLADVLASDVRSDSFRFCERKVGVGTDDPKVLSANIWAIFCRVRGVGQHAVQRVDYERFEGVAGESAEQVAIPRKVVSLLQQLGPASLELRELAENIVFTWEPEIIEESRDGLVAARAVVADGCQQLSDQRVMTGLDVGNRIRHDLNSAAPCARDRNSGDDAVVPLSLRERNPTVLFQDLKIDTEATAVEPPKPAEGRRDTCYWHRGGKVPTRCLTMRAPTR
jgi:hypothetical protein